MRSIPKNSKGILLFEVIIAVAILAVGLTTVSRSFSTCLKALENTKYYNAASFLADEVFFTLENTPQDIWPEKGTFEGYPAFSWNVEVTKTEDARLRDVEVNINWKERNEDYKLTIFTLMPEDEQT
ncbi:MAG: hypothetical protein COS99_06690 [Candidatus Omnitrophica bacterium CG07_land_8_20_14_0_80_42_15]|uniref:Type II secretion system protein GspI C-terminal domain-containing protein n=1 Tax=Candidatus Aquitaenariimonas noxiae TaxID=1974741 RepID=A0A2J0L1U2_9BACT|nr:MAG: hypothetical protein COS99_06690 [Candidatus Omnitrophica bacterium CG07_land_8_20_14_0_80_42_15]